MSKPRNGAQRERLRQRVKATRANCWLCGEPIDYTLPITDPKAFVIDHVIPIAKGGADALANVKAAHRIPVTATPRSVTASYPQ